MWGRSARAPGPAVECRNKSVVADTLRARVSTFTPSFTTVCMQTSHFRDFSARRVGARPLSLPPPLHRGARPLSLPPPAQWRTQAAQWRQARRVRPISAMADASRFRPLMNAPNKPPRADWLAAVHLESSLLPHGPEVQPPEREGGGSRGERPGTVRH